MTQRTDWREAREAVRQGQVVFFPRLTLRQVWSVFSYDIKKGLRLGVKRTVYSQALGCVAWRVDEEETVRS